MYVVDVPELKSVHDYQERGESGVPWGLRGLRIQCYHCCGKVLIPGRENLTCLGGAKKKKKKKKVKVRRVKKITEKATNF